MLSAFSERKMLSFRGALFVGWLVILASLFWDPITPKLTNPDNDLSPFRVSNEPVLVQGEKLVEDKPYSMSNRIFWTMLVPIIPIFLMVFGHEAWRRICPLSFASQIPRYLGLQRKKSIFQRRTGVVQRKVELVNRASWIKRNTWYIQLGLLFVGLNARLLLINSDRLSLALFFIFVILIAMLVGMLWGGKTWCNYFCPVNIVQRIYTEPGGILESSPHITRPTIPQSMCRDTTPEGDKSACVSCITNCGDIDLEQSYWETIAEPARRHVYYMFFGLIVGFYGYYYVYAGNWDYYFSGIWTRETGLLDKLMLPGLYLWETKIAIPRLAAAPLFLLVCAVLAWGAGSTCEAIYRKFIRSARKKITETEIVHHCLCVSAFISINVFYLFGGRPNILLMPPNLTRVIDVFVVVLSMVWLWQALNRSQVLHRKEGLASGLLRQLKKLNFDVKEHLDGRSLDELKPDEIYVLTKVLPNFSHAQKLESYKQVLDDAILTGKTSSSISLELLKELRDELGISEDEHNQILDGLGMSPASVSMDIDKRASEDKQYRLNNYRDVISKTIIKQIESGESLESALLEQDVKSVIDMMKASFHISDSEHIQVFNEMAEEGGIFSKHVTTLFEALRKYSGAKFCMQALNMEDAVLSGFGRLISLEVDKKIDFTIKRILCFIHSFGGRYEGEFHAHNLRIIKGEDIIPMLNSHVSEQSQTTWLEVLDSTILDVLQGVGDGSVMKSSPPKGCKIFTFHDIINSGLNLPTNLRIIANESKDPVLLALVISAFSYIDAEAAVGLAAEIVSREKLSKNWLLEEVLDSISNDSVVAQSIPTNPGISFNISPVNGERKKLTFTKQKVTVGRAPGNDITITDTTIQPYHFAINCIDDQVKLLNLCDGVIYVNGELVNEMSVILKSGDQISFNVTNEASANIEVSWDESIGDYTLQNCDTVTKMLWLSSSDLAHLKDLTQRAEIAATAEVRNYVCGAHIYDESNQSIKSLYVKSGKVIINYKNSNDSSELTKEDSLDLSSDVAAVKNIECVNVVSDFAVVVAVLKAGVNKQNGTLIAKHVAETNETYMLAEKAEEIRL